jgi:hypothetical protein
MNLGLLFILKPFEHTYTDVSYIFFGPQQIESTYYIVTTYDNQKSFQPFCKKFANKQSKIDVLDRKVASPHHAEGRVDPVDLALKNRPWF